MKHFTFRLFLIRKLIESLMWSCIDEYTEFEDIADGLAKAHSAMEKMRKPEPMATTKPYSPETIAVVRKLSKTQTCEGCDCGDCPFDGGVHPVTKERALAWLAEHGIKE